MNDKQRERLPEYAKRRLELLEHQVQHWKDLYEGIFERGEGDVFISRGMDELCIGSPTIRFCIESGYIDVSIVGHELRIRGERWVSIYPSASNSVNVVVRD